jgi:hypothetical protein
LKIELKAKVEKGMKNVNGWSVSELNLLLTMLILRLFLQLFLVPKLFDIPTIHLFSPPKNHFSIFTVAKNIEAKIWEAILKQFPLLCHSSKMEFKPFGTIGLGGTDEIMANDEKKQQKCLENGWLGIWRIQNGKNGQFYAAEQRSNEL